MADRALPMMTTSAMRDDDDDASCKEKKVKTSPARHELCCVAGVRISDGVREDDDEKLCTSGCWTVLNNTVCPKAELQ